MGPEENPAEPERPATTFEDGLWNGRPLRDWLDQAIHDVVEAFDPRQVILFGSAAMGEEDRDSDLDLLVVFEQLDPDYRLALQAKVKRSITAPVPVDVVVTDVEELEHRRQVVGSLERWASREGRVMYDRRR